MTQNIYTPIKAVFGWGKEARTPRVLTDEAQGGAYQIKNSVREPEPIPLGSGIAGKENAANSQAISWSKQGPDASTTFALMATEDKTNIEIQTNAVGYVKNESSESVAPDGVAATGQTVEPYPPHSVPNGSDDAATSRTDAAQGGDKTPAAPEPKPANTGTNPNPFPKDQRRPPAWKCQRITLDEFRRRYFFDGCRPKRAEVKRWIEEGTAEGETLSAFLIDGRYYIQIIAADNFIASARVKPGKFERAERVAKAAGAESKPGWRRKKTYNELSQMGFPFMRQ